MRRDSASIRCYADCPKTSWLQKGIDEVTEVKAKLEYTVDGWLRTLELTDEYLVDRWAKGKRNQCARIALDKLCPEPSYMTARPRYSTAKTLSGLLLVALSAVCYFSAVQEILPLLSFLLCIIGLSILIRNIENMRLETWTIFQRDSGEPCVHIIHRGCDDAKRQEFIKECRSAIISKKKEQPTPNSDLLI